MKKFLSRFNLASSRVKEVGRESEDVTPTAELSAFATITPQPKTAMVSPSNSSKTLFAVDESHIEVNKAKQVLGKLLVEKNASHTLPTRLQRSTSQWESQSFGSFSGLPQSKQPCIIDDLRIVRKLGSGSFGSVWKAENTKNGDMVAIKKVLGKSFQEQTKFLKEAEILYMSNHPNVLRFLGLFIKRGEVSEDVSAHPMSVDVSRLDQSVSIYLCTEYCRGGDLTKFLKNEHLKTIPWTCRLALALDIARGLKYLHAHRIVHRDIKGENVLLKPIASMDWANVDKTIIQKSLKRRKRTKFRGLGLKIGEEDKSQRSQKSDQKKRTRLTALSRMPGIAIRTLKKPLSLRRPPKVPPRPNRKHLSSFAQQKSLQKLDCEESLVPEELECEIEADLVDDKPSRGSKATSFASNITMASSDYDSDDTGFVGDEKKIAQSLLNSRAILADVGLARYFQTNTANKAPQVVHHLMNIERMTIRGTPWTMAPELISNKLHYTTASDIFSLGIVFLEISLRVTPEPMFLPRNDDCTPDFRAIDQMPVDPLNDEEEPQTFVDSCPATFRDLCIRCCHLDPLQRPTANELVRTLEELVRKQRKTIKSY